MQQSSDRVSSNSHDEQSGLVAPNPSVVNAEQQALVEELPTFAQVRYYTYREEGKVHDRALQLANLDAYSAY